MATLLHLSSGAGSPLAKVDPGLEPSEQAWRAVYAAGRFRQWLTDTLRGLSSQWNIALTPAQQLDDLLQLFASGERLTYGTRFKPLQPIGQGVWELKTEDLRIFGWFPCKDNFVGVVADTTFLCKKHGLYRGYLEEAVRFRDSLDLDHPKFIPGDDPNAVVRNFDYA